MARISVVVITYNEGKNIKRCLKSARRLADETILVDQHSSDRTVQIAKKFGARIFSYKHTFYVEPSRNFALDKASGKHILILDADEEIPASLAKRLKRLAAGNKVDFVRIPRKNIIFGKWIKHSRWWPDYNVRFFKKGQVAWSDKIHSVPLTRGQGKDLKACEEEAIIHHHYQSISQYLGRMNRYADIQVKELVDSGYQFSWADLIKKPTGEFLSRFFAGEGYRDGIHGLVLALLQAFSELVKYLKVWEKLRFKAQELPLADFSSQMKSLGKEVTYWLGASLIKETRSLKKRLLLRLKQKLGQ